MFKEGIVENDIMLEKQYKPLIKELRKTATRDDTVKTELKEEPMDYEETDVEQEDTPTAVSTPKPTIMNEYELETVLSTPEGIESTPRYIDENSKHPLATKYMNILIKEYGMIWKNTRSRDISYTGMALMSWWIDSSI